MVKDFSIPVITLTGIKSGTFYTISETGIKRQYFLYFLLVYRFYNGYKKPFLIGIERFLCTNEGLYILLVC